MAIDKRQIVEQFGMDLIESIMDIFRAELNEVRKQAGLPEKSEQDLLTGLKSVLDVKSAATMAKSALNKELISQKT